MPHLTLEFSNNINQIKQLNLLFERLHQLLAEQLPTQLSSCKSRCVTYPLYFIGDQNEHNAFVHLTLKILAGRSDSKKNQIGTVLMALLDDFFKSAAPRLHVNLSLEILDLDPHYFKN